ncbi:hypothetical protein VNO78_28712 [Psophocarpus tetragonolobus]|uniref:Uncharacterized protein n=1 Tax=Psophocarpus tetragonolobus TaxID=3891 RepID=A0AAN9RTR5_PSOTE
MSEIQVIDNLPDGESICPFVLVKQGRTLGRWRIMLIVLHLKGVLFQCYILNIMLIFQEIWLCKHQQQTNV